MPAPFHGFDHQRRQRAVHQDRDNRPASQVRSAESNLQMEHQEPLLPSAQPIDHRPFHRCPIVLTPEEPQAHLCTPGALGGMEAPYGAIAKWLGFANLTTPAAFFHCHLQFHFHFHAVFSFLI